MVEAFGVLLAIVLAWHGLVQILNPEAAWRKARLSNSLRGAVSEVEPSAAWQSRRIPGGVFQIALGIGFLVLVVIL